MKMKRYIGIGLTVMIFLGGFHACNKPVLEIEFEDLLQLTILDYILENDSSYSSFLSILEKAGIDKVLSAYNPNNIGYTLFLPPNDAIDRFIQENDQYSSLQDILDDSDLTSTISRYHVVNMGISADDFPFGALPEYTLSGDILTVSFVNEPDTSYYKIYNQAPVSHPNIELSNGFIHIIESALIPITETTYDWLGNNSGYSIFKAAVEATGFDEVMDADSKDTEINARPFTLLLEHDSIYKRSGINTIEDLIGSISPEDNNYTDPSNPLNGYVAYHMLEGSRFMDDFADKVTNYTTFSDVPVNINGYGLDILINSGKEVFDTIVEQMDTTIINFIGFYYDASNVLTQSGAIHLIDQVLKQQRPSRADQIFDFSDEPLLDEYRDEPADYLIEDTASLEHLRWTGTDLNFIVTGDPDHEAIDGDYLYMDGQFTIKYEISKIVQGVYTMFLRAETLDKDNALVEVTVDGKPIGGLVDLSSGGNVQNPYRDRELGTINFVTYEEHTITIESLIPGKFSWDAIIFEPYIKN
jgi:uncharacterized surface protein with fasciclin (FAS1) repeats